MRANRENYSEKRRKYDGREEKPEEICGFENVISFSYEPITSHLFGSFYFAPFLLLMLYSNLEQQISTFSNRIIKKNLFYHKNVFKFEFA